MIWLSVFFNDCCSTVPFLPSKNGRDHVKFTEMGLGSGTQIAIGNASGCRNVCRKKIKQKQKQHTIGHLGDASLILEKNKNNLKTRHFKGRRS